MENSTPVISDDSTVNAPASGDSSMRSASRKGGFLWKFLVITAIAAISFACIANSYSVTRGTVQPSVETVYVVVTEEPVTSDFKPVPTTEQKESVYSGAPFTPREFLESGVIEEERALWYTLNGFIKDLARDTPSGEFDFGGCGVSWEYRNGQFTSFTTHIDGEDVKYTLNYNGRRVKDVTVDFGKGDVSTVSFIIESQNGYSDITGVRISGFGGEAEMLPDSYEHGIYNIGVLQNSGGFLLNRGSLYAGNMFGSGSCNGNYLTLYFGCDNENGEVYLICVSVSDVRADTSIWLNAVGDNFHNVTGIGAADYQLNYKGNRCCIYFRDYVGCELQFWTGERSENEWRYNFRDASFESGLLYSGYEDCQSFELDEDGYIIG